MTNYLSNMSLGVQVLVENKLSISTSVTKLLRSSHFFALKWSGGTRTQNFGLLAPRK